MGHQQGAGGNGNGKTRRHLGLLRLGNAQETMAFVANKRSRMEFIVTHHKGRGEKAFRRLQKHLRVKIILDVVFAQGGGTAGLHALKCGHHGFHAFAQFAVAHPDGGKIFAFPLIVQLFKFSHEFMALNIRFEQILEGVIGTPQHGIRGQKTLRPVFE